MARTKKTHPRSRAFLFPPGFLITREGYLRAKAKARAETKRKEAELRGTAVQKLLDTPAAKKAKKAN